MNTNGRNNNSPETRLSFLTFGKAFERGKHIVGARALEFAMQNRHREP